MSIANQLSDGSLKWSRCKIPDFGPLKWAVHLSGRRAGFWEPEKSLKFDAKPCDFEFFRAFGAIFLPTGPLKWAGPLKWSNPKFENRQLVHLTGRST